MSKIGQVKPFYRKDKRALKIDYTVSLMFSSDNCKKAFSNFSINEEGYGNFFYKEPISAWANSIEIEDRASLYNLVFTISSFDWYNIDKLMKYSSPKSSIYVQGDFNSSTDFKLVYPNNRMIFPLTVSDNKATFSKAPQAEAFLFAVKFEQGKINCFKQ